MMCVSVSSVVVELKDGLVRCGRMSDGSIQREGEQCRKEREKDMEVVMQQYNLELCTFGIERNEGKRTSSRITMALVAFCVKERGVWLYIHR